MSKTQQDAQWLKAKSEFRVISGIIPGQGKGAHTHPSILATPFFNSSAKSGGAHLNATVPSAYMLTDHNPQDTGEPSDGKHFNFQSSVWKFTYDDAYHHYADYWMYTLCGPGAADVTTYYWPNPTNYANYTNVVDPLNPTQPTSWNGSDVDGALRMRGYLAHLGYQIKAPTWTKYGMLDQSYYQTGQKGGASLQAVRDAVNWEASGENTSNWSTYFYIVNWNNNYSSEADMASNLHNEITTDLYVNHVPLIVEIPAKARYLPNWPNGTGVNHFVTIVGYDDTAGQYTYVDTCKGFTGCNNGGLDSPDFHTTSQQNIADGVWSISTNQTTGDGGWVW